MSPLREGHSELTILDPGQISPISKVTKEIEDVISSDKETNKN